MRGMLFFGKFVLLSLLLFSANSYADELKSRDGFLKTVSIDELNRQVVEHLKKQVKVNSYNPRKGIPVYALQRRAAAPMAAKSANNFSTTNVQEQGVDEADLVKTDGRYIYAINNQPQGESKKSIRILDTKYQGSRLKQIAHIGFGNKTSLNGLYLMPKQQRLVVMGSGYDKNGAYTNLFFIDISKKHQPRFINRIRLDGQNKKSRRVGDVLYIALSNYLRYPSTYVLIRSDKALTEQQKSHHKQKTIQQISRLNLRNLLPRYSTSNTRQNQPILKDNQIYSYGEKNVARLYGLTSLLAIDLNARDFRYQSVSYFGDAGTFYASDKAIYLTSSYIRRNKPNAEKLPETLIHKFAYKKLDLDYRGTGVVLGNLGWNAMSSFQMDEDRKGNLRVVTYNWSSQHTAAKSAVAKSPVIMSVLQEHPQYRYLRTLSQLPNNKRPKPLGKKGERLYGARLFNDYAYFVTFKNTDPLYVVDLRNPYDIKVTGELIIPGFSDYLHPIGDGLLLGVGKNANNQGNVTRVQGMKLSLFDIRNPQRPKEVDKIFIGKAGSHSPANHDHHAVTVLAVGATTRVALPISENDGNYKTPAIMGLHRFEVDKQVRKLKRLAALNPPADKRYGNWLDRSIIIGDQVYYYHNSQFWKQDWGGKDKLQTAI